MVMEGIRIQDNRPQEDQGRVMLDICTYAYNLHVCTVIAAEPGRQTLNLIISGHERFCAAHTTSGSFSVFLFRKQAILAMTQVIMQTNQTLDASPNKMMLLINIFVAVVVHKVFSQHHRILVVEEELDLHGRPVAELSNQWVEPDVHAGANIDINKKNGGAGTIRRKFYLLCSFFQRNTTCRI